MKIRIEKVLIYLSNLLLTVPSPINIHLERDSEARLPLQEMKHGSSFSCTLSYTDVSCKVSIPLAATSVPLSYMTQLLLNVTVQGIVLHGFEYTVFFFFQGVTRKGSRECLSIRPWLIYIYGVHFFEIPNNSFLNV